MAAKFDMEDLKRRMNGALEDLKKDLGGLRTGRASVSLLDPVQVNAYGSNMPLNQCANVSAPEPRLLTVQVWDRTLVTAVEKGIRAADLGLNPSVDGQTIRVRIPDLTEERRRELSKIAAKYAEQHRISIRNVRREGMEQLKAMEKTGELSQDDHRKRSDEVQKLTDGLIAKIDETLSNKEREIMQV